MAKGQFNNRQKNISRVVREQRMIRQDKIRAVRKPSPLRPPPDSSPQK